MTALRRAGSSTSDPPALAPHGGERFAFIDGLRGVAVLLVVLCHVVSIDFGGHEALSLSISPLLSHGVDLFFVISGFCLANIFSPDRRVEYVTFLVRRFSRIAPTFYIALTALTIVGATQIGIVGLRPTGSDFVHSLLFLIPLDGARVNGTYWTLAIEARWYAIFPAVLFVYRKSPRAFIGLMFAAYALYEVSPIFDDAGYLPCFMLGILAADLVARDHPIRRFALPSAVVLTVVAVLMPRQGSNVWHANSVWHLACFALVVAGSRGTVRWFLERRPLGFVGDASYSIYLMHLPILYWCDAAHAGIVLATASSLGLSIVFWRFIERPLVNPAFRTTLETAILGMLPKRTPWGRSKKALREQNGSE